MHHNLLLDLATTLKKKVHCSNIELTYYFNNKVSLRISKTKQLQLSSNITFIEHCEDDSLIHTHFDRYFNNHHNLRDYSDFPSLGKENLSKLLHHILFELSIDPMYLKNNLLNKVGVVYISKTYWKRHK